MTSAGNKTEIRKIIEAGVPIRLTGVILKGQHDTTPLLDASPEPKLDDVPDGTFFFTYTCFDVAATAYFYLDRPEDGLHPLQPCAERCAATK